MQTIQRKFFIFALTEYNRYEPALRLCFRDCQPNVSHLGYWYKRRAVSDRFFPRMGFRASVGGRTAGIFYYQRAVFRKCSDYPFPAGYGSRHREILDGDALCLWCGTGTDGKCTAGSDLGIRGVSGFRQIPARKSRCQSACMARARARRNPWILPCKTGVGQVARWQRGRTLCQSVKCPFVRGGRIFGESQELLQDYACHQMFFAALGTIQRGR